MLSYLWTGMVLLSLLCACATGTLSETVSAAMAGAAEGVQLTLSLAGVLCLWSGVCRVMEAAGLSAGIARLLRPLLQRLFPDCSPAAFQAVSANIAANLLGLGNAATPLGIEAVKRLRSGETPTDEMCRFVVLNTASIQLLPTTIAALRGSCGAFSPFDILPAVWLSSGCALAVGLAAAVLLGRVWRRRGW